MQVSHVDKKMVKQYSTISLTKENFSPTLGLTLSTPGLVRINLHKTDL